MCHLKIMYVVLTDPLSVFLCQYTSTLHDISLPMAQQPLVGQGLLIIEASRSHSGTPHSVGLLWTSDQLDAETATWQHTTLTRDRYPCPRRDSNPQCQNASGRRPTPQNARPLGSAHYTVYPQDLLFSQYFNYWYFPLLWVPWSTKPRTQNQFPRHHVTKDPWRCILPKLTTTTVRADLINTCSDQGQCWTWKVYLCLADV
jgi:hypothetical protein